MSEKKLIGVISKRSSYVNGEKAYSLFIGSKNLETEIWPFEGESVTISIRGNNTKLRKRRRPVCSCGAKYWNEWYDALTGTPFLKCTKCGKETKELWVFAEADNSRISDGGE
jgi:hypothetical protein